MYCKSCVGRVVWSSVSRGGTPGGAVPGEARPGLRRPPAAITLWPVVEPKENPLPRYRWPWLVLAAFLLGVALAIAWMSFAVLRERQERDVNAPLRGASSP